MKFDKMKINILTGHNLNADDFLLLGVFFKQEN